RSKRILSGPDGCGVRIGSGDARAGAGGGGRLWSGFLCGGAKNTGNRGADSDGCTETQCACTDPATGSDPNRIWIADWAGSFPCFGPVPQEPLIPSEYGRSADVRRSLVADACGYRYRLLCACAASERGGSAGGAALGIKPGSSVVCERRGRSCKLEGIVLTN